MTTPPPNRALRLILMRPELQQALEPVALEDAQQPATPALAAMSLLLSRDAFWRVNALTVGFAIDEGEVEDLTVNPVSDLVVKKDFGRYASRLGFPADRLLAASRIIDAAILPAALSGAQKATLSIDQCVEDCKDKQGLERIHCLATCISNSSSHSS